MKENLMFLGVFVIFGIPYLIWVTVLEIFRFSLKQFTGKPAYRNKLIVHTEPDGVLFEGLLT